MYICVESIERAGVVSAASERQRAREGERDNHCANSRDSIWKAIVSFFIGLTFFVLFFFLLFYFRRNFCICRLRRCRSVACVQLTSIYIPIPHILYNNTIENELKWLVTFARRQRLYTQQYKYFVAPTAPLSKWIYKRALWRIFCSCKWVRMKMKTWRTELYMYIFGRGVNCINA